MSDWIAVSDKVPEQDQQVVALFSDAGPRMVWYLGENMARDWWDLGRVCGSAASLNLTHWLPLPPAPPTT